MDVCKYHITSTESNPGKNRKNNPGKNRKNNLVKSQNNPGKDEKQCRQTQGIEIFLNETETEMKSSISSWKDLKLGVYNSLLSS